MSNHLYRTIVLVGDDIYADIATCYLANQLRSTGVNICRIRGLSSQDHLTAIDVDHSIHVFNEDVGINFTELMSAGVFTPQLVRSVLFSQKNIYFESYPHLKDDLPAPHYQIMARLICEGVVTQWESASPLVALHNADKFHPELHQFYQGNVRPYGGRINAQAYSEIINSKSLSLGVKFLSVSKIDVDANIDGQYISAVHLDTGEVLQDAFYIDMTLERRLAGLIAAPETINVDAKQWGLNYLAQPWVGNCLALGNAAINIASTSAPVNPFEWLFKALVRFVDFFPCNLRQDILACEYNRLQTIDNLAISDFLQVYQALIVGNGRDSLPERLRHRINLFAESCQLSENAADWAYPSYWPALMVAAGVTPQHLPRRVEEIPLEYLVNWCNQRLGNIDHLVRRSHSL